MGDLEWILGVLNGGGDAALIAISIAIWRVERRVYRLELQLKYLKLGKRRRKQFDAMVKETT